MGFTAAAIDGKMSSFDRKRIVRDFGTGALNVMTSCSLVSEGFDVPAIRAGFDMNPTLSLKEYLQRCGRTLRKTPGDDRPVLLMDQDRARWDRLLVRRGLERLDLARSLGGEGPYVLQASIDANAFSGEAASVPAAEEPAAEAPADEAPAEEAAAE